LAPSITALPQGLIGGHLDLAAAFASQLRLLEPPLFN